MIKNISTSTQEQIIKEYLKDNRTPNYLCKKYNISQGSLRRFLFHEKQLPKRHGWTRENKGKTICLSDTQKIEILKQYNKGLSINAISKDTKISYRVIQFFLHKELNLTLRDGRQNHIKPNIVESLISSYKNGTRLIDLSKKYNTSYKQCKKILLDHGIKIGKHIKYKSPIKDRILNNFDDILKQYKDGATMPELSKQYKYSPTSLLNIFKENNINIRSAAEESKIRYNMAKNIWPIKEIIDLYINNFYSVKNLVQYLKSRGYSASRQSITTLLKENNVYLGGIKNSIERRENKRDLNRDDNKIQEMYNYRMRCTVETEKSYRKYKNIINPQKLHRSLNGYHIDHMFSVKHGFLNKIDPKILCNPLNLQMLSAHDNIKKQQNSSITKEQLFERYNNFLLKLYNT